MSLATSETRLGGQPAHQLLPGTPIQRLFERISEVSTLPDVAMQIMQLANDPTTGADDLLDAVRSDPALAMRVMRTVNSSYHGIAHKVADLKQAITLLGFEEIRSLALTAFVARIFQVSEGHKSYSRRDLWNHMVATALVSKMVARECGHAAPQEAYLAGLLHDFGIILLDQYVHAPFCRVLDALEPGTPSWEVEKRILGFDHASLGAYVAARWNLPESLADTIGYHHIPGQYDGPERDTVNVVVVANYFCHAKDITSLGIRQAVTPDTSLFADLGLNRPRLKRVLDQLDDALEAAREIAAAQFR